jgi:glucose/arabinose dehydrogenase
VNTRISVVSTLLAALVVCGPASSQQRPEPENGPWLLGNGPNQLRVVQVARDLLHPWSLAFLPNGDLLVAETNGNLRIVRDDRLADAAIWNSTDDGGEGLKSIAVHPEFEENRLIYAAYGKRVGDMDSLAIGRGTFAGDSIANFEEIFVANAWETSGNLGGRILFGPDNTLYITVGDRDRLCCIPEDDPSIRLKAQDLDNHIGKTLRIRDDGGVPADNPFVGRSDALPEIFTYGHRNGYGLSFHPETGELWQAEIGPMGGDEVNILIAGHNYGWPLVSTGRNYTGTLVSDQPWARPGMDNPRFHWAPSISPSSILFYTGDKFPQWQNNLFVGGLSNRRLIRIAFGQPSQAEPQRGLLTELNIRVRDVAQSPDGYIYVATEQSSGGPNADGMVLRLEPPPR